MSHEHVHLVACHECDLLQNLPPMPGAGRAYCARCGYLLRRRINHSLEKSLALTLTGLILFILSNLFPFLALNANGLVQDSTLISGSIELYRAEQPLLALVVLMTTILFPLSDLLGMLYVLLPLKMGRRAPGSRRVFRHLQTLRPWGMLEIFMLGVLVALVKLGDVATVVPGVALYSFALLILTLAAANYVTDPEQVWQALAEETR